MTAKQVAFALIRAGISALPIKADGSKGPAIDTWKPLQTERMTTEEVEQHFLDGLGVGIICGPASGNLEVIDIEGRAAPWSEIAELIEEACPGLLDRLPQVATPSGGRHIFYRCSAIEGNQKLAGQADANDHYQVLIETRGIGGYVLAPGCPAACHVSGNPYTMAHGRITATPEITPEERQALFDCCRSFNTWTPPQAETPRHPNSGPTGTGRPGDDYNARGPVLDLMQSQGWAIERKHGDEYHLRRPGKKKGASAIWHDDKRFLYVFSSNASPFDLSESYTPHAIYTALECGGLSAANFTDSTRKLAADGFGSSRAQQPPPPPGGQPQPPPTDDDGEPTHLPLIQFSGGALAHNVDDAERALSSWTGRQATGGVYVRGAQLVTLGRLETAKMLGSAKIEAGSVDIYPMTTSSMRTALTRAAMWVKPTAGGDLRPINAPEDVARSLHQAGVGGWRTTPYLAGVTETPVFRPDGSLIQTPGYDADSGLFFDTGDVTFPPIPAKPTKEEGKAALDKLLKILIGFPFRDEASRSAVLAAMLTPLIRHAVRAAPLFAFSAPKAGSGKTLLADVVGYLATGRETVMISQATNEDEEKKRYLALLMQGSAVICIDNVEKPLSSDTLCTILSEPIWQERILGMSRTVAVSTKTTWIATGNNIVMRGDLSARAIQSYIDAGVEHPDQRAYDINLREVVPRKRAELVAAGLTVILSYMASSDSVQIPVYGRFEQWSRFIREPLVWLGMADPCDSRESIEESDPVSSQLAALLKAWHSVFGKSAKTTGEAIKIASDDGGLYSSEDTSALKDAMLEIADNRGSINGRSVGRFIARHAHRYEGGLRFVKSDSRWLVEVGGISKHRAMEIIKQFGARLSPEGQVSAPAGIDSDLLEAAAKVLGYTFKTSDSIQ